MSTDRDRSPRGDGASTVSQSGFINIEDLSSANKIGWIHGQLSNIKIKDYTSGAGKLMFGTLSDNSGSVKIIVFNNDIERFEKWFKEGAWVRLNGFTYSEGPHGKEIKVSRITSIFSSPSFEIKLQTTTWVNCEKAKTKDHGEELAIIGCIYEVLPVQEFMSRAAKNIVKRTIVIIDQTEIKIELVIWGIDATSFNGVVGDAIEVPKARVNVFREDQTVNVPSSGFTLNSNSPEAVEVKEWFSKQMF